ncbi:hypothetical protein B0O80DRAFT_174672 [Mortierella sp. GBAus27b]|nr:hypothetical protein B0O80DRAFT_174672 [Mortierella sp. GBAus27b]
MEQVLDLQCSTINVILAERTKTQWQESPEFASLLDPLLYLEDAPNPRGITHLSKLMHLACQSDDEQSTKIFLVLEANCAIAEPTVFAQLLSRFVLEGGAEYPSQSTGTKGWLAWSLDYKPELARRGQMLRRLWKMAEGREDIENLAIQLIVASLIKKQEAEKDAAKQRHQGLGTRGTDQDKTRTPGRNYHDVLYMLHCGPLADRGLPLWDEESALNALVKLRDGGDQRAVENQLLILVNLLDRLFSWIESKESEECVEQLKLQVSLFTKAPELLVFAMDTVLKYLDGRWSRSDSKDEVTAHPRSLTTSLLEINRSREPVRYVSTEPVGAFGFGDSRNGTRGKSLKERDFPRTNDRGSATREFEIGDLVARCIEGHDSETIEQLLRRLMMHIGMVVDTAMVGATGPAMKHAAQQRDKVLLRLIAENPAYRRIMVSAMDQVHWSAASLCLPVIQGMLRCSIAHWSTCKNGSPKSYPKELEEATWLAQLTEQTGLIPDPVNQASVLFPVIESKDVGLILEQCYYILLVRNADALQQGRPPHLDDQGPETSLLRRLVFKHATKAFHLMPLFTAGEHQSHAE